MKRIPVTFIVAVVCVVLLGFGGGIFLAGLYTLWVDGAPKPGAMPGIVSYFVSVVNGTLAANLGALLGIRISLSGWREPQDTTEKLQWVAAVWYVLMLVVAAVFWGVAGFTEDPSKVVSLLPEMTKNGIGIVVAILAVGLGVQTAITRAKAMAEQERGGH